MCCYWSYSSACSMFSQLQYLSQHTSINKYYGSIKVRTYGSMKLTTWHPNLGQSYYIENIGTYLKNQEKCNFLVRTLQYFFLFNLFLPLKTWKNCPQKLLVNGPFFFHPAQNQHKSHFLFNRNVSQRNFYIHHYNDFGLDLLTDMWNIHSCMNRHLISWTNDIT